MPTKSSYPPIDIPDVDITTFMFDRKRDFDRNAPALIDGKTHESYSYADIEKYARQFGAALQDRFNWKKDDVLCLFSLNTPEFTFTLWGTHYARGTVTCANPAYTSSELAHQLRDSGARMIIAAPELVEVVEKAIAQVGRPITIFTFGKNSKNSWWNLLSERQAPSVRGTIDPVHDKAFILYSSGTTGLPKGVMLSHKNIVSTILQQTAVDLYHLKSGKDVALAVLPFFHIYGLTITLHGFVHNGIPVVVLPRFDMIPSLELIQRYRVSMAHYVPPIVLNYTKNDVTKNYDLSSMRMVDCGAAPLSREMCEAFYAKFGFPCKQGYGLTETTTTATLQAWDEWRIYGSVGGLMPNMEAKFVDDNEKEVAVGATGELWLRGPNIMMGYLNNPTATKDSLTLDGYFKTGDIGHVDEKGNYFITDRKKELIKTSGFQVAPAELEGLLLEHELVLDVGVIGVPHSQHGEVPRAYIMLSKGVKPSKEVENELMEFVKKNKAYYKQLTGGIEFVDTIPKSASGKILRRMIRDQYLQKINKAKL